jgi:hypothetical protein
MKVMFAKRDRNYHLLLFKFLQTNYTAIIDC